METLVPIAWPAGGLVETWSFSEQPEGSAREYQNVRLQDPTNGRLRGAKRAGLSKFCPDALKAVGTKVSDLLGYTIDNRQITFTQATPGTEEVVWEKVTPSGASSCPAVKTDADGNVYAIDGNAGIVKYSADGVEIWKLALPTADPAHIVRALAVDDFGVVYAGVSQGGSQATAKMWAFQQTTDNKPERLWEITPDAYVEDFKPIDGSLYTIQNRPNRAKAYVRIYSFADTTAPELTKSWRVPYPCNALALKSDKSVVIACAGNGDTDSNSYLRAPDPKYPLHQPDSVHWTPENLSNATQRIWAWYIGDDIDEFDVGSDFREGVEVVRFRDRTNNHRDFFAPDIPLQGYTPVDVGPKLALDACLEHKGLRWTAPDVVPPMQSLQTSPNPSVSANLADQQRTMVPGYTNSMWFVAMAIRIGKNSSGADTGATGVLSIWGQDYDNSSNTKLHQLWAHTVEYIYNPSLGPTYTANRIAWYTGATHTGADGTGSRIQDMSFASLSNEPDVSIICQAWDGGQLASNSFLSVNGDPDKTDIFTAGQQSLTSDKTYLSLSRVNNTRFPDVADDAPSGMLGDILEIVVLDMKDRNDPSQGVLSFDNIDAVTGGTADQNNNEYTRITGYLAHKYGVQGRLPPLSANHTHPYGWGASGVPSSSTDGVACPPKIDGTGPNLVQGTLNKRFALVAKYKADGAAVWAINESTELAGARQGGYGYGVAVNSDGNIYSMGPEALLPTSGKQQIRMLIDQGDTVSINTVDGAWSATLTANANQTYAYPRMDVDEFDNVYVPFSTNVDTARSFIVYSKTGVVRHYLTIGGFPTKGLMSIAVDRRLPDYRNDLDASFKSIEHIYISGGVDGTNTSTLLKIRLVNSVQTAGSPRSQIIMGVSGGDIVRFDDVGVTVPAGGSAALDSDARYIQSATLFKTAYWTDGRQYREFDSVDDVVTEYKCESSGSMPARCALIEAWRGRIVLARSADEPHNWFMSKKDTPNNYDFFPTTPTEIDAIAGNSSSAGLCPDIINSVVPYSEDILVFGGDHSIWMLVGDPAAGGRFEMVSDITGMAFGRPWCKDPDGVLFFIGSRGGLFRWTPGATPSRVSTNKIERQLQSVDFSTHYMRLAWNQQDEGVHIFQLPFGAGGTRVDHWFWEARPEAFAKDIFGTTGHTNIQPTAVCVVDGDGADDRLLLLGCEDGFVRKWDKDSKSDDVRTNGTTKHAIDSLVTIFPLQPDMESPTGMELQFHGLTVVLGDRDDGCRYELFSSDVPDAFGTAKRAGVLSPGRNPPKWDRVSGAYCGLRLRNAGADERFAYERGYIYATPAGMARPR